MERYPYRFIGRPRFLIGTFNWKGRGYAYEGAVPEDIHSSRGQENQDPWMVLASVAEAAKSGDRSGLPLLRTWARDETVAPTLSSACLDVIGDAGQKDDLEFLAEMMLEGPRSLRIEASQAMQWAGALWLVPYALELWRTLERQADRDAVEINISNLLDSREREPVLFGGSYSADEYVELVTTRVAMLKADAGRDEVAVMSGEPVDMDAMIWKMRKALVNRGVDRWVDWGPFLLWRHKFEAYTGTDCSTFYSKTGAFQPLNATVVLERYIAEHSQPGFVVGDRYFFGHQLPWK
jgi:hypothetical protein